MQLAGKTMTRAAPTSKSVVEETWEKMNAATTALVATMVYTVPKVNVAYARMARIVLNLAHVNVQASMLLPTDEHMATQSAERSIQMDRALDAGDPSLNNLLSVVSSCTRADRKSVV